VSGRLEQLARQIRKLRTPDSSEPARTLQRALHLASDLAAEHAEGGDFAALAAQGIIDGGVAERLTAIAGKRLTEREVTDAAIVDLDVFLRSLEHGAPAPPLVLPPLAGTPKLPPGVQKTALNISGRVITLVGKEGRAFVLLDDKPTGQPFDLPGVPAGEHDIAYLPDGTTTITWEGALSLTLSADFKTVSVGLA
jgi:hypothetical protein